MRKIRRSEFLREREEYWAGGGRDHRAVAEEESRLLDDMGYEWDPEVVVWPEEIIEARGVFLVGPKGFNGFFEGWGTEERRREAYREAARRWGAYSKAVKWLRAQAGLKVAQGTVLYMSREAALALLREMGEEVEG